MRPHLVLVLLLAVTAVLGHPAKQSVVGADVARVEADLASLEAQLQGGGGSGGSASPAGHAYTRQGHVADAALLPTAGAEAVVGVMTQVETPRPAEQCAGEGACRRCFRKDATTCGPTSTLAAALIKGGDALLALLRHAARQATVHDAARLRRVADNVRSGRATYGDLHVAGRAMMEHYATRDRHGQWAGIVPRDFYELFHAMGMAPPRNIDAVDSVARLASTFAPGQSWVAGISLNRPGVAQHAVLFGRLADGKPFVYDALPQEGSGHQLFTDRAAIQAYLDAIVSWTGTSPDEADGQEWGHDIMIDAEAPSCLDE